ncbi:MULTISPECIES: TetR/AcrR family transcriptional regulator [Streptomyces]|uniref:TetR/AcrR family transcriptional regulator n=1 Tax=Streptomyces yunnanensis TaxID=156453 RepID=A0ABY7ZZV4_9ACTN|nr:MULTISPECIES: TetR/AcrR family transcriptional regulator [Streptomyces]AJC53144.1 TetR family transcriptional regulator [Streptomyces sp. 769]WEB38214.1 TetR/AcrR family transcriptional regulator [Streptomyces yunnanensis]
MTRQRGFATDEALLKIMQVFWVKGYEATSIADLCEATGLGRGSLYAAFGSKQEVYERSLRHYVESTNRHLRDQLARQVPVRQAVRDLLLDRVDGSLADAERPGCLLVGAIVERVAQDESAARIARDAITATLAAFASALHSARAAGEIPYETDVDAISGFLTTMVQGLRIMSISVPDRDLLVSIIDAALTALPE